MNKKKLFSLVLAAALGLSMAACGGDTANQDEAGGTTTTPQQSQAATTPAAGEGDLGYVQSNGKLKVGFTYFAPMNYMDDNGEFVGFETEFAKAVAEKLDVEAEFVEVNWDSKLIELNTKNVDCLWNGMTVTDDIKAALTVSDSYIRNYQVVVIRSADADKYKTTADLADAKLDAEAGSAGEAAIAAEENLSKATYTSVPKQTAALQEVKTGAADACVLDFVLAGAMVGQGDYADLTVIPDLQLSVEEYAVGFRKDSDLAEAVNKAMAELLEDGTLQKIAEKYDLDELLIQP